MRENYRYSVNHRVFSKVLTQCFVHRLLLQELEGCLARQPWGNLAVCGQ